jgi:hypothetical protein
VSDDLPESLLDELERLSLRGDPPPWRSMVEGRDHLAGDSFIQIGRDDDRDEDMYVSRDSGPAGVSELDLIAAARNCLPLLIAEVRRLRRSGKERESPHPGAGGTP